MASPTVEMALGGSFMAQVVADMVDGNYWRMRSLATSQITGHDVGDFVTNAFAQSGNLSVTSYTAASVNLPGQIPDGGCAIQLDGSSRYMSADSGRPTALPALAPFTIEVILTLDALPGGGVEPCIAGNSGLGITYTSAGNVSAYHNGSSFATYAVAAGSRVHLVLTRAATATDSIVLYVNGVNRGSTTPAVTSLSLKPCYFGKHWTNAHYLTATYEFAALYSSALSSARVLAHYNALAWTDVTGDTLGDRGLVIERGIRDDKPDNRVASTGTCAFSMNNLGSNSGGVTGYYSPGHASCRTGFAKGTPVRVKTGSDTQFIGRIRTIAPEPGRSGVASKVLCTDFIDRAATFLMEGVSIIENVTGDYVFNFIADMMPNQPHGITTYTGTETYTLVLDNTRDEAVSAQVEFGRLAISELGYIYVNRSGTAVYEARGTRITNAPTATITLADTMHGMDVAEVSDSSLNRVQVTVHPRAVDSAATTVLFALTNPLQIASGETKTIFGPYRTESAPGITTRVGGLSMVTPVAVTDYLVNIASDGTGVDRTDDLTVVANFGANGVQFVLTNGAVESAYITKLQCRGKGVYDFRTVVLRSQDDEAIASDGVNPLSLDMVYQEDPNVGQAVADDLRVKYGDLSGSRARTVTIYPDAPGSPSGITTADISTRVAVSETRTGVTGEYYINGVKHEYRNRTLPKVTWWLTPASPMSYWILGLAGASELGTTTYLAPA